MISPKTLKALATVLAAALGAAATVAHEPWVTACVAMSAALLAWVHGRRPGDVSLTVVD